MMPPSPLMGEGPGMGVKAAFLLGRGHKAPPCRPDAAWRLRRALTGQETGGLSD